VGRELKDIIENRFGQERRKASRQAVTPMRMKATVKIGK